MCKSSETETVIGEIVNNNNVNNSNIDKNNADYAVSFLIIILSVVLCKVCDLIGGYIRDKFNSYIERRTQIHISTENLDRVPRNQTTRN